MYASKVGNWISGRGVYLGRGAGAELVLGDFYTLGTEIKTGKKATNW